MRSHLLRQMDEFAQSRYKLESRYHHVLVDEFQDTSRAQWELVSLLVESWGHGFGLVHDAPLQPSIFLVGDRKQSIYRFRDADVAVIDEASRFIEGLREAGPPGRAIAWSFRASRPLLAFVNDLFADLEKAPARADAFRYDEQDRFPDPIESGVEMTKRAAAADPLGIAAADDPAAVSAAVADEIVRLLTHETVRDRDTGVPRPARPADVAILFRSRESHREYEAALEGRGVPAYVYKGLGFFEADEVKDLCALMRYLAEPDSNRHAAALLRSGLVRVSDESLKRLAPTLAAAIIAPEPPAALDLLDPTDRALLSILRSAVPGWLSLVDRITPAELIDRIVDETVYAYELRGARVVQARENVKKLRGLDPPGAESRLRDAGPHRRVRRPPL